MTASLRPPVGVRCAHLNESAARGTGKTGSPRRPSPLHPSPWHPPSKSKSGRGKCLLGGTNPAFFPHSAPPSAAKKAAPGCRLPQRRLANPPTPQRQAVRRPRDYTLPPPHVPAGLGGRVGRWPARRGLTRPRPPRCALRAPDHICGPGAARLTRATPAARSAPRWGRCAPRQGTPLRGTPRAGDPHPQRVAVRARSRAPCCTPLGVRIPSAAFAAPIRAIREIRSFPIRAFAAVALSVLRAVRRRMPRQPAATTLPPGTSCASSPVCAPATVPFPLSLAAACLPPARCPCA